MYSYADERERMLRQALESAKAQIAVLESFADQVRAAPSVHGYVVSIDKSETVPKVLVSCSAGVIETACPDSSIYVKLAPGVCVRVLLERMSIVGIVSAPLSYGNITTVKSVHSDGYAEIDVGGGTRRVLVAANTKVEEGDRVVIDAHGVCVLTSLGKDQRQYTFNQETNVSWDDIGGLHEAKTALIEAIELPFKHAALYKKYGKKPIKGVLLYGPPGCGKTMLGKATASAIANTHNGHGRETAFVYVKGPELLDKWVGNSEAQIRSLFASSREHMKKYGYPAVIFIDEADALLGRRGSSERSTLSHTIVPQFLSEMDGLEEAGAMVLLSTNRPDTLDPAIVRDGRIDRKVRVTRPDQKGTEEILSLYLKDKPLNSDVSVEEFSQFLASEIFNPNLGIYNISTRKGEVHSFQLSSLINGAMAAGIVEYMTTLALRREIAGTSKASGLTKDDGNAAVQHFYKQNFDTDHTTELEEFCDDFRSEVTGITKMPRSNLTALAAE